MFLRKAVERRRRSPRRKRSKSKPERRDPLDEAVRALARRDYSARGLDARLERAGIDDAARAEAVAALERSGYLDDERVARDRAARLADRGQSDAAIRFDLERQALAAETIEAALASLESEVERAKAVAVGLGGGEKAARTLVRRGFAEESIEAALPDVAEEGRRPLG
jgi:SOS response regulatory protein OraA/RecX